MPAGGLLVLSGNLAIGPRARAIASVADGVTTSASPTVTSATAVFVASDVGRPISGTNIPASSYIGVVNSGTSIGLSSVQGSNTPVNATASGTAITLTFGAYDPSDEDTAADVSGEITRFVVKATVDTITIPATMGFPTGYRGGAADYSIELSYLSTDGSGGVILDILHTAALTTAKELGFWGSMRNAPVSATNPLWSGTFIVVQAEVGGDAETLSLGNATYPLTGAPTQVTADY